MTSARIFASARPTLRFGPVLPMTDADAAFWAGRARAATEARARREARQSNPKGTRRAQ